jgi:hypothetical protein
MCKKEMSFQRKRSNNKSVHVHRREHREQKQLGNNQRLKNTATDKIAPPHFSFINLKHLLPTTLRQVANDIWRPRMAACW